ncbi:MAG: aminopeptidase P family protein [Prevotella sp.]|nr:aminopeptidase P family protein [Prevotella sp.]
MTDYRYRLEELRREMRAEKIDAIIFPSSDPHGSEYVAPHWRVREWITGFTGSAGTAVVTLDEAALWTDSRYFLQAERELRNVNGNGGFSLMKEGLPETPSITEWLLRKLSVSNGRVIAIDGLLLSYSEITSMQEALRKIGVTVRTNYDAAKMLWKDRPEIPKGEIYSLWNETLRYVIGRTKVLRLPEQETGQSPYENENKKRGELYNSASSKLSRIREVMREKHCDAHVVTDLMSIAWTLNLRGNDVPMTPVFVSNLIITLEDATVYVNGYLTNEAQRQMQEAGVRVKPYGDFAADVKSLEGRVLIDPAAVNFTIYNSVKDRAVDAESPIMMMKAVKSADEIAGFRQAMLYDGVAMVRFLRWLKPAVEAGGQTEISVSDKLEQLRRECPHCLDLSFSTICGYMEHGAIVHYSATPESDMPLKAEGLLLIDSGGQYDCGTTDITRTIALGPVTDEMKHAYTYVLKANIALATAVFPEGTNGTQIDSIARSQVWQGGYNYMHGTGHGVGWRLCVHEGPHAIRMDWRPAPLKPGMVVTDEPGIYLEGKFGIRTENMMMVEDVNVNPNLNDNDTLCYENFLHLTPLTLCPIDTAPIDFTLLTEQEKQWLNDYHSMVREKLKPLLTDDADKQWLEEATKAV